MCERERGSNNYQREDQHEEKAIARYKDNNKVRSISYRLLLCESKYVFLRTYTGSPKPDTVYTFDECHNSSGTQPKILLRLSPKP